MKTKSGIKLGSLVRDIYTGFQGVAVAKTEWLYGCSRICIEPQDLDKDGKPVDQQWFDEQRIEVIKAKAPKVSGDSKAKTGGPQRDPVR